MAHQSLRTGFLKPAGRFLGRWGLQIAFEARFRLTSCSPRASQHILWRRIRAVEQKLDDHALCFELVKLTR